MSSITLVDVAASHGVHEIFSGVSLTVGDGARVGVVGPNGAGLAALLLARHEVYCLDEPTNDLDFDGLARLERFVQGVRGSVVVVSHDREFLDRTVDRIVELEEGRQRVREWTGGWSEYEAA